MKIRNILPLVLFSLLAISILLAVFVNKWIVIAATTIEIFLVYSIYAAFAKNIKEENLYINVTVLQNISMGVSSAALMAMVIGLTFKVMHWPFAGPILLLSMLMSAIPLLIFILDVILNYKKIKTSYGYSYLIILLPAFVFIQSNLGKFISDGSSRDLMVLKNLDDHKQYCAHKLTSNLNTIVAENFKNDTAINNVHSETIKTIEYINKLRRNLINTTGGYEEGSRSYVGAKEKTAVELILVGAEGPKSGRGYDLKKKLDHYIHILNKRIIDSVSRIRFIALDGKDDPSFETQYTKSDFAELQFKDINMIQAMNKLSQLELEVLMAEQQFLLYYQSNSGKNAPATNN
jgi:hypothetical protein